jgi:hypothetical protein
MRPGRREKKSFPLAFYYLMLAVINNKDICPLTDMFWSDNLIRSLKNLFSKESMALDLPPVYLP